MAKGKDKKVFDVDKIKKEVGKVEAPRKKTEKTAFEKTIKGRKREYVRTGIEGFDKLFETGIPKGSAVLIAGGAGSGKTITITKPRQRTVYHPLILQLFERFSNLVPILRQILG